jgi:hypothetical protein
LVAERLKRLGAALGVPGFQERAVGSFLVPLDLVPLDLVPLDLVPLVAASVAVLVAAVACQHFPTVSHPSPQRAARIRLALEDLPRLVAGLPNLWRRALSTTSNFALTSPARPDLTSAAASTAPSLPALPVLPTALASEVAAALRPLLAPSPLEALGPLLAWLCTSGWVSWADAEEALVRAAHTASDPTATTTARLVLTAGLARGERLERLTAALGPS